MLRTLVGHDCRICMARARVRACVRVRESACVCVSATLQNVNSVCTLVCARARVRVRVCVRARARCLQPDVARAAHVVLLRELLRHDVQLRDLLQTRRSLLQARLGCLPHVARATLQHTTAGNER